MTKGKIAPKQLGEVHSFDAQTEAREMLRIAQLYAEKCELRESKNAYLSALAQAKKEGDLRSIIEAISGLLRLSGEALDEASIERWDSELDDLLKTYPGQTPSMVWYCKGAVARHRDQYSIAQRYFHRYLKAVRTEATPEEGLAKGWLMLATLFQKRGKLARALLLVDEIFNRYESKNFKGVNGTLYILLGLIYETKKDYKTALTWYQKAHVQFLGEHNWYYYLYVLYGYARVSRHQQNFSQAYWYLDLIGNAVSAPEFGLLRNEVAQERSRLGREEVDLLIDSRKGMIQTREGGQVSLRKQYVLLYILEALTAAHRRSGRDIERGLSKGEIIEYVWKESYRPEIHDNKLYYNINRLRKLIEPNIKKPQYLMNWKQGYRLAPGLRVQFVEGSELKIGGKNDQ